MLVRAVIVHVGKNVIYPNLRGATTNKTMKIVDIYTVGVK
jgi:hypothetical protein